MDRRHWLKYLPTIAIWFLLLLGASSCVQEVEAHPRIWIDSPLDGAPLPSGTTVTVISHTFATQGVAEVLLTINGEAYRRDTPSSPGAQYVQVSQDWQPPADGTYAVQVQAYDITGQTSSIASITIRVGEATPNEITLPSDLVTPTFTPVITVTPEITITPPLPGEAAIQFWADPAEIQAGDCTTIRWQVENASRVIFGGVDQPLAGSYQDCMCTSQRYTLTVIQLDGSEVKRSVDIAVSGVCETPEVPQPEAPQPEVPQQDTTPPPAPSPAVPANGLTIACRASQNLAWLPVSDPSGVAGYYVRVERRASPDAAWASAGESGLIADKQFTANVECGWYYRWRVSAQDGVGNASGWSGWSSFVVTLE